MVFESLYNTHKNPKWDEYYCDYSDLNKLLKKLKKLYYNLKSNKKYFDLDEVFEDLCKIKSNFR